MKPITPQKVEQIRIHEMPEAIIQAVNELIVRSWNGSSATVKVEEIVDQYYRVSGEERNAATRKQLFDKHYLDIEPAYREAGWKVKFESPDYTESFPSYFVFSMKK